jgi:pyruvate/2-oxoglutarate dehydrogenase complex dihydrolipoamide acyltransferase (E2) component
MDSIGKYTISQFPDNRKFIIDSLEEAAKKHLVYGLVEVDITRGRQLMRERRRASGQFISFTGWIAKCIGQAVSEHKNLQAHWQGRKQTVTFEDVDVAMAVERFVEGRSINLPYIVRRANEKSVAEISREIQTVKTEGLKSGEVALGGIMSKRFQGFANRAPKWVRKIFWRKWQRDAFLSKKIMGTVILTSVSMFGNSRAFIIPFSIYTLGFGMGGIARQPGIVGDRIEIREFLHLTIFADHDIVDGAPLARFTRRLVELIEEGFGLEE